MVQGSKESTHLTSMKSQEKLANEPLFHFFVWFPWVNSPIQPGARQIAGNQPLLDWKCKLVRGSHF